jgi:phosphoribosyl-ATP pyrophosphohydrolase
MAKKPPEKKTPEKKTGEKKTTEKKAAENPRNASERPVLDGLYRVILSRKSADPQVSHSARLLARGKNKVAQKFGEEAVECLIEAVHGSHAGLVGESADVLYHLLVMWVASGVEPEEVWTELRRREGVSGIVEKAARAKALAMRLRLKSRKIP